jgi:hypothetical protein
LPFVAGQVTFVGRAIGDQLEHGVATEGVVVVLVLVAGQDTVDTGADHLQERVLGEVGVARVVQSVCEVTGEPDAVVELANGEQPVAGELARRRLDDEWRGEKVEDL